ncbi:MAG TPA: tRNA-dihydrouridine synthase [Candidatus Limnocylindrales bacterium]|nr:tRNA-dihydrouridine synthase [Candidatus Limnocylindrales bacterium]
MSMPSQLPQPFFVLAPMDDVTDTVFRRIVGSCAAPDLYFTEFVNVDGLQSPGRERVSKKLQYDPSEQPLIAQIWGKNPDNFYKTAQELVDMGFAGVDINMGCPEKNVVANGTCSALINNRPLASEIIKATQAGVAGRLPVSVKTRLGFSTIDLTWHEFLLEHSLDMLTVHGRTRKEMSLVPAHWEVIGEVRELRDRVAPDTLIVGNGDVLSRQQGEQLARQYGLDGIMVGRGIFQDPYLFAADSPWESLSRQDRIDLYKRQVQLFADTWQHGERRIHTLNKFCKVYINGFDGAKELREQLMAAESADELLHHLHNASGRAPAKTAVAQ